MQKSEFPVNRDINSELWFHRSLWMDTTQYYAWSVMIVLRQSVSLADFLMCFPSCFRFPHLSRVVHEEVKMTNSDEPERKIKIRYSRNPLLGYLFTWRSPILTCAPPWHDRTINKSFVNISQSENTSICGPNRNYYCWCKLRVVWIYSLKLIVETFPGNDKLYIF